MEAAGGDMTMLFLTSSLDTEGQREAVLFKVQEFLSAETQHGASKMVYLGQAGWEHVGRISCLTHHLMSACRRHGLLPSPRSILLSLHDQYQAIQLCLARINKKKHGEFMAAASDVMDVWNEMHRRTLTSVDEDSPEYCDDLSTQSFQLKSQDPAYREMKEIVKDYEEFLISSACLDHFSVYKCLKKNLQDNQEFSKDIYSMVYIIEGVEEMPTMEKELLKLIFKKSQVYKLSSEFYMAEEVHNKPDFNVSGITENDANSSLVIKESQMDISHALESEISENQQEEISSSQVMTDKSGDMSLNDSVKLGPKEVVTIEGIDSSLLEYLTTIPKNPCQTYYGSETEMYVERLILAHLRLLINTRDELALTLACSMPGREITQQGFSGIRCEAQRKNMPIYQTILSFILKHRLGGKGYQADPSNPILLHVKPLGEFVDSIMKLQNIVEEEADQRKGAVQVLATIKNNFSRMKGCVIKRTTIDKVCNCLNSALGRLMDKESNNGRTNKHKESGKAVLPLQSCLKHLVELCDESSGHVWHGGIVDALGENFLTQYTTSKKLLSTPVRIPTVLSLFQSPVGVECEYDDKKEDLMSRAMRRSGIYMKATPQPKRYQSVCDWAPGDLSPISSGGLDISQASPITGPSLKVMGRSGRTTAHNWREIVNSVTQNEDMCTDMSSYSPVKSPVSQSTDKPDIEEDKVKRKSSKRSLLTDITNVAKDSVKKRKPAEKKGRGKLKPLPAGQKSITSFFKV